MFVFDAFCVACVFFVLLLFASFFESGEGHVGWVADGTRWVVAAGSRRVGCSGSWRVGYGGWMATGRSSTVGFFTYEHWKTYKKI